MTSERWQKVKAVFQSAIEFDAGKDREKFLRATCREDPRLLKEVEALIRSHEGARSFIQNPFIVTANGFVHSNTHADLHPGQQITHYEIEREIGRGGMGSVYLARDTVLTRSVTLKFIDRAFLNTPQNVRRFEREACAASALNHPNILTIHELGEWNETRFIAAEFVDGETLREKLNREFGLSLSEAVGVATQIASALQATHAAGIVHRDIKPENIMLRPDGLVKLLDFGIAKLADKRTTDFTQTRTTQTGLIIGTPKYMSPEQARGLPVDARTDVWSLGCVLYEMVTGCPAFDGETTSDLIAAVLEHEPVPCEKRVKIAPAELQRIVSKSLMKKADDRYSTIAEMAADLQHLKQRVESGDALPTICAEGNDEAIDDGALFQRDRTSRRLFTARSTWGFAALLFAVAALLSYTLFFRDQPVGNQEVQIESLAVLPFKTLNGDAEGHLGIGIADTIITKVSQIERLIVRPTSAVQKYAASETDSIEAGRQLGVDAVLEGSVHRAGERLRVSANLRRTSDGASLWAETFDMRSADIFAIEDEVSRKVLTNLRFKLNPTEVAKITRQFTTNADAYEFYVRGMQSYEQRRSTNRREAIHEAIELFKQAVALDPNYALAHAQLANCYANLAVYLETENPVWVGQAKQEIRTAETLDPNLAETHLARHELYYSVYENFQNDEAFRELRRAQELNPSVGHIQMAHLAAHLGFSDLAMRAAQRAMEIDPTNQAAQDILIVSYEMLGKYPEAIASSERYFPDYVTAPGSRPINAYLWERRFDEVEKIIDAKIAKISKSSTPGLAHSERALLWMMQGKTKEAMAEIPSIVGKAKPGRAFHHVAHNLAAIYALDGKAQDSVEWLKKAASTGLPSYPMFARDPNFDRIRNEPEFTRLMADLKTRWEDYNREFQ
jgi:eukaryotic-like serine/threonine-protein kinase